jgi:hypothetical protein
LRADPDEDIEDDDEAPVMRDRGYGAVPRQPEYESGAGEYAPRRFSVFDGTPYEIAPPEVQRDVVARAQSLLARQGLYRSDIDGVYGPGTQFALRAYQTRTGIAPTGALDMETLASLDLLPRRQRAFDLRRSRPFSRNPFGERIYTPR